MYCLHGIVRFIRIITTNSKAIKRDEELRAAEPNMQNLLIHVERDSVCMGDDVNAPHRKSYKLSDIQSIKQLVDYVAKNYSLAHVNATDIAWVLMTSEALAVFSPVLTEPRVLTREDEAVSRFIEEEPVLNLYFAYIMNCDHEQIYQTLKGRHATQQQVYKLQRSLF
jgi:hypothetical protein